jgi:hypothetical protein
MMTEVWPARLCWDSRAVRNQRGGGQRPLADREPPAFDGVDVEQVLEEALHPLGAALDALHRTPERWLGDAGEERAHPDGDRVEGVAEVVDHHRQRVLARTKPGADPVLLQAALELRSERLAHGAEQLLLGDSRRSPRAPRGEVQGSQGRGRGAEREEVHGAPPLRNCREQAAATASSSRRKGPDPAGAGWSSRATTGTASGSSPSPMPAATRKPSPSRSRSRSSAPSSESLRTRTSQMPFRSASVVWA